MAVGSGVARPDRTRNVHDCAAITSFSTHGVGLLNREYPTSSREEIKRMGGLDQEKYSDVPDRYLTLGNRERLQLADFCADPYEPGELLDTVGETGASCAHS